MTKFTSDLLPVLEQIERDKGVKTQELIQMIEGALVSAFRKHSNFKGNLEAVVDLETGMLEAYMIKTVVEKVVDSSLELTVDAAKKYDPKVELGGTVKLKVDTTDFSRIAAQTAKQVILQKIREVEKSNVYQEYKGREEQLVNGFIHRIVSGSYVVELGKVEAIIPPKEQVMREKFKNGDRIRAMVLKVDKDQKGARILLTRCSPVFVKLLFEQEVPELADKTVEIVEIVREPGERTKLAVISHNKKVDPVGACVGVKGSRVKPIIDELHGERIDLIAWNDDPVKNITSALSPAKIEKVIILDEVGKRAEVIVSEDQLSLAIGKKGQNVMLAAKLTKWHLDIKSPEEKKKEIEGKIEKKDVVPAVAETGASEVSAEPEKPKE